MFIISAFVACNNTEENVQEKVDEKVDKVKEMIEEANKDQDEITNEQQTDSLSMQADTTQMEVQDSIE
ncbi:MAG: hypothetical protein J5I47_04775 [Vicingus serpentipes]|nr:hypothetical protein [Vicingus serpentipes]